MNDPVRRNDKLFLHSPQHISKLIDYFWPNILVSGLKMIVTNNRWLLDFESIQGEEEERGEVEKISSLSLSLSLSQI